MWVRLLVVQGLLLVGLGLIGCAGHSETDPEIAQAIQSRIKRLADSADDGGLIEKSKVKGTGQRRAK